MAVAMVFTVVKVNDSKKVVKAGEGSTEVTTPYTDDSYLGTTFGTGIQNDYQTYLMLETMPERNIYVQNNKIQFVLPAISNNTHHVYFDNKKFSVEQSEVNAKYIDFVITDTFSWKNGETTLTHLSNDNKQATLVVTRTYTCEDNVELTSDEKTSIINNFKTSQFIVGFTPDNDTNPTSYTKNVITLNYNVSADTKFTVSGDTITDTWPSSETDYYYGENQFVISATDLDGTDETTVSSRNAAKSYNAANINDSANRTTIYPSDGTYYLYHRYVTNIDDGTTGSKVWFTDAAHNEQTVIINYKLKSKVEYTVGTAETTLPLISEREMSTIEFNPTRDDAIISNIDPNSNINLKITTDEIGAVKLYNSSDEEICAVNITESNSTFTGTVEIPGNASNNAISTYYKLVITGDNSEVTHNYKICVNYSDTRFGLTDVKINNTDASTFENSSNPLFTKEDSVNFSAVLTQGNDIDAWVKLDGENFTLTDKEDHTTYKDFDAIKTCTFGEEGLKEIVLTAGTGQGENSVTEVNNKYYVFYDSTAPVLDTSRRGVIVTQNDGTNDAEPSKYTTQKDIKISFYLKDIYDGSDEKLGTGVKDDTVKVKFGESDVVTATKDETEDAPYIATIANNKFTSLASTGGNFNYTIVAEDNAGNANDKVYEGSVTFAKEKYGVDIAPIFTTTKLDDKDYAVISTTQIAYRITITSEFPIVVTDPSGDPDTKVKDLAGAISANFYNNATESAADLYVVSKESPSESNGQKYVYVLESEPIGSLVDGTYSIKIRATNVNGYTPDEWDSSTLYYVDLSKPLPDTLIGITNNGDDWSYDNGDTWTSTTSGNWYKNVFVVISGVQDTPNDYATGIKLDTINVSGMTFDETHSRIADGLYIYQVTPSEWETTDTSITDVKTEVSFSVRDNLGNERVISGDFHVDNTPPVISDCKIIDGEKEVEVSNGSTIKVKSNVSLSAVFSDTINLGTVQVKCTSANPKTGSITPSTDGRLVNEFLGDGKDGKSYTLDSVTLRELLSLNPETAIPDGSYVIQVSAKDLTQDNSAYLSFTIIYDGTEPVIEFSTNNDCLKNGPAGKTYNTAYLETAYKNTYNNGLSEAAKIEYKYYKYVNTDVTVTITVTDSNITNPATQIKVNNGDSELTIENWDHENGTDVYTANVVLSDAGSYNISAIATDDTGNKMETISTQNLQFIIDKEAEAPTINLSGTKILEEDNTCYRSDVTVSYTLNDPNKDDYDVSGVYSFTPTPAGTGSSVENASFTFTEGSHTFEDQGVYTVTITAKDMAGNSESSTTSFTIDKTPPVVEIDVYESLKNAPKTTGTATAAVTYTGSSDSATYNYYPLTQNSVDVILTADDVNNKTITVSHTLNGTAVDDNLEWDTTASQSKTITVTAEGTHVFTINATDLAGNTAAEKTVTFTIDSTPPAVSIKLKDLAPKAFYGTSECPVSISLAVTDNNRDVADEKIYIKYTALDSTVTNTTVSGGENPPATTVEDPGTYEVYAVVTDKSGRTTTTDTTTFVIDKTNPEVYVSAVSNSQTAGKAPKSTTAHTGENAFAHFGEVASVNYDGYYRDANGVTVTFKAYDLNLNEDKSGIKVYNGTTDITSSSSITKSGDDYVITTPAITKYGSNDIYVTITDSANQTTTSEHVTFVYDNVKPSLGLTFDGETASAGLRKSGIVSLAYSYTDDYKDAADVKLHYTYTPFNGTAQTVDISNFTSASFPRTGEGDGKYEVTVTVRDMAGMTETKSSWFIIDKAAPQLNIPKIEGTAPKMSKFPKEFETTYNGSDKSLTYAEVYGSSTVKVTIDVFDYDINVSDTSAFVVYDNGKEVEATFKEKEANEYTATVTISGEGSHHITASATDRIGHTGSTNGVSFIIDTTDPSLDLTLNGNTDPEDMLRVDGDVAIGYKLSDTNNDLTDVKITYNFTPAGGTSQGDKPEDLFNNSTRKFTENGTYKVTITAIDKAGNSSNDKASFVIDKQKPEIDLKITTSKPAKFDKYKRTYKPAVENYFTTAKDGYEYGQYYKDNVKVKISVFDYDVKGTVVYDNDDEVEVSFKYEGNGLYTGEFTISEEGSHVIKAESVDKSGNTGKSSELSFIIDKTAPALTTTLDGETYSGTDRFCASDAVVGLKIDDKNQDADDVFRSYVITPSDHSAEKTDSSYVTALQETYKQNAYYTVTYTVVDRAGNSSTAKIGFTIDTTKPQSDIKITTKAPAKIDKYHNEYSNTNGHFNTAYTYGQYYNESVSMDMAVFDYNVAEIIVTDNDEAIPVTFASKGDERVASSVTVSSEGEHVVKIIVKDKSGNEATSKSVSFIIDKSEPGLSATLNNSSSITEQYLQGDASVYLSVSDTNEDEDDVTRIVKMTRPSASAETSEETGALEGNVSYSTEADYEITYTAIDRAGNKSDPITLTFRVDKTAPQLSFSGITRDATAAEDTTITYNMLEDFYWDMTSATVKIYQKVDGMGETPIRTVEITASGASTALSETFKEDGQYRFEFTAQDKAGNQATESFTFILDENAPVIILSGVDGYLTDQDVNFGVQVDETFYLGNNVKIEGTVKTLDDPNGVKINFDDYSRLTRMASANFEQLFTEDGIYNIKVTSKDVAGNETVQSIQFTIDKSKPLIKDLENLADEEDYQAYSDAVAANDKNAKKLIPIFNEFNFDYDADDIVTDLTTVTYKMYMDGVLYDGLSEIEDGFHTLKITAEDEVGNTAEKSFYFILDTVKPGIIVTGVEEGDNLQEPTTITVSLQLTEDTLKAVNLNGEAIAITNNTATLEVSDKGDYVLVIEAGDDAGNLATLTIKFEYGKTSSMLWLLIAGGAALMIAAATFFIILGKKRKKNQ